MSEARHIPLYGAETDSITERERYGQMKAVQQDMTSGSPMKIILNCILPILLGNVFQQV